MPDLFLWIHSGRNVHHINGLILITRAITLLILTGQSVRVTGGAARFTDGEVLTCHNFRVFTKAVGTGAFQVQVACTLSLSLLLVTLG